MDGGGDNGAGRGSSLPDPVGDVLVARGVERVYWVGFWAVAALRGLDLAVERGSFISVVGPSDSRKTTLLQCVSELDDPDAGSVETEGEHPRRLPEARRAKFRARRVGFVLQALNLVPVFSAAENAELPLLPGAARPREARRAALERVGLSGQGAGAKVPAKRPRSAYLRGCGCVGRRRSLTL